MIGIISILIDGVFNFHIIDRLRNYHSRMMNTIIKIHIRHIRNIIMVN